MGVPVSARQLNLFRSRRQRGTLPPAPSEFANQASLVDLIRHTIHPAWRFTHFPAGALRDPATAGRLKRLGLTAGWPDLQFAGPGPRMAFLELKRRGGRLSEAQQAMRDHLVTCGFAYLCTDESRRRSTGSRCAGFCAAGFRCSDVAHVGLRGAGLRCDRRADGGAGGDRCVVTAPIGAAARGRDDCVSAIAPGLPTGFGPDMP
jgi:hypothetical protein